MLELRFGVGGDDSKHFLDQLFSAYVQYATRHKLKVEFLTQEDGHIAALVSGAGAYELFKHEPGKHCVQRVPENDRKGRKQTSIVVVGVLPVYKPADTTPLRDCDLHIDTAKGSGPGGQHKNATESAVRMRHKPTGLVVFINGRDQQHNKIMARKILTSRVHEYMTAKAKSLYNDIRSQQLGDSSRGDKVRTYNLSNNQIVDHVLGTRTNNVKAVFKGQFELLFGVSNDRV